MSGDDRRSTGDGEAPSAPGPAKPATPRRTSALRRVLLGLVAGLVLLVIALVALALSSSSAQPEPEPAAPLELREDAAIEHLAAAIRLPTVSVEDLADFRGEPFRALHELLLRAYPCVHRVAKREVIADYSLLFTWEGSDPERAPGLFVSHSDVVPAEDPDAWQHPPFAGEVADGYVWGRGAHDDKGGVIVLFEAAEALCNAGFAPTRTLYLAVDHDEETRSLGAKAIAERLRQAELRFEFIIDEGLVITTGILEGLDSPVALVGVAEKGLVTLELRAEIADGHSSMPPEESAAGILAAGLARLESEPFDYQVRSPLREMLATLGPELPFARRLVLTNLWLFEPLIVRALAANDQSRAFLHTTTAITVVRAGIKENVLPREASALVNYRILPGDSVDGVIERTREVLDDPRIEVSVHGTMDPSEPSAVSTADSPTFAAIAEAVRAVRPEFVVAPSLMIARTDSVHYADLAENIYRFRPIQLSKAEISAIHGRDERVRTSALILAIRIYAELLRRIAGET